MELEEKEKAEKKKRGPRGSFTPKVCFSCSFKFSILSDFCIEILLVIFIHMLFLYFPPRVRRERLMVMLKLGAPKRRNKSVDGIIRPLCIFVLDSRLCIKAAQFFRRMLLIP